MAAVQTILVSKKLLNKKQEVVHMSFYDDFDRNCNNTGSQERSSERSRSNRSQQQNSNKQNQKQNQSDYNQNNNNNRNF